MRSLILNNKIFIVIFLLGAFLRFFRLGDYPIHLNHDEMTQLYDSISIAQTGKDIYGNFLPFIFPSIGDFKPPFYTYITSIFYFVLGWNELIIRLPGAIFGVLIIPAIYFFTLEFLKKRSIALASAFFTAIAPFEIFFARKSFENGAGVFMLLIGFMFLFKFLKRPDVRWLYFSVFVFAFGMYTYFSHALIIPILLVVFVIKYRAEFANRVFNIFPVLLFLFLIAPLFFMILSNSNVRYRSQTVFIGQDRELGRLLEIGKTSNQFSDFFVHTYIYVDYVLDKYLKQFDPVYLFTNGLDLTNQGLMGAGPLLLVQMLFVLLGTVFLIRNNFLNKERSFILLWVLIAMLPSALTFEKHSPHRVVMVFVMLNVVSGIGLSYFIDFIKRYRKYSLTILLVTFCAIFLNVIYFLHIYFVNYPYEKSEYLQYPFKDVAEFAWSQYPDFESIVFDPSFGDISPMVGVGAHYYLGYFGHYPPEKFQREFHVGSKPREVIFDKFSIRQVYWPADRSKKNTLFIVSVWTVPLSDVDQSLIIRRFNFYNGRLAFYAIKL